MSEFGQDKHYRSFTFLLMLIVFFAVLCGYNNVVTGQMPEAALAVDSACDKILKGDFESAQEIVRKSIAVQSIDIRQLGIIIDEYVAIQARRDAHQNDIYLEQKSELDKLKEEGFPKDIDDVGKVFTVALKALEYSNKEQGQALLNDPYVQQTVRQAKLLAAEYESQGRWLDAYAICYDKLALMYEDDDKYSAYAKLLQEKADIAAFLQDSPCETCQERYDGIDKQMFIKAVDFLDSSYVSIIDYRSMAIKGINRCKLLADIISNPYIEMKNKIRDTRSQAYMAVLTGMLDELNESQVSISKDKLVGVFERVLAMNESQLGGMGLPPALLVVQFANGALSSLDPYTVIYWPSQAKKLEKALTNQFIGIGIRFSKEDESPKVLTVLPDTPAYHSGLEAGDVIVAVDGVGMGRMSPNCVAQSIAGPEGTKVTLTVRHEGEDKTRDITLHRTSIVVSSIRGWQRNETDEWRYMIDAFNKIGYIRISCFDSRTVDDFERTLIQLEKQGLKGLILDLRSNPGGLLNGAIEIADMFIKEGLIARIQPRCGMPTYVSANREKTHPDYPLVVLIDRYTASSAEILSGVLQEPKHNRATIIGERSYGKSSVQSIVNHIGEGAKLKYTTAYYYLPSGQKIKNRHTDTKLSSEDWGVLPDVNVKLRSAELRNMAKMQRANELTVKGGLNNGSNVQRFSSRETIDGDPQLATGILVLKSKMIESGRRLALN
ncbi:MAG: S41 family peptidase [Planctomycetes bacterium]|nr:S41 family peptidase [Planctomycetota bacterium]MBL7144671.1 S41 family peptidase [Phycisphaerae bacterium]